MQSIRNLSGSKKISEQENISTLRWKPEGVFGIIQLHDKANGGIIHAISVYDIGRQNRNCTF